MEHDGLTFGNYFVSDSLCCPSRASIFTGNYPHDTDVLTNAGPNGGFSAFYSRGDELHTFALALQQTGYLTALMGKYLNGYLQGGLPTRRTGQRRRPAGLCAAGLERVGSWPAGATRSSTTPSTRTASCTAFGHQPIDYLTDVLASKGTDFIDARRSATSRSSWSWRRSPRTPRTRPHRVTATTSRASKLRAPRLRRAARPTLRCGWPISAPLTPPDRRHRPRLPPPGPVGAGRRPDDRRDRGDARAPTA